MLRTTHATHYSTTTPQVDAYDQIRQAITGGNVKSAVVIAIGYLKAQPPSNLESAYSELQQIGGEMQSMEFITGIMNLKAESMFAAGMDANIAPPNFNDEPGVVHYASSTANAGIDLSANFDRTTFSDALKPGFPHISPSEKQAIKTVVPMVGNVFDAERNHVGTCLRVGDNTVLMPLHCARRLIDGGRVQFFNPQTSTYLRCGVVQIVEQHAHIDMAVVQLEPVAMPLTQLKFAETVLDGEKLYLLHYPKSIPGEALQISGNQVQIADTQDQMSMVVNHDTDFGSSGGVYVNTHGEIAGLHIGADSAMEDILGRQKYACTVADTLDELPCDSEIYDFLVPEGDLSKPEIMNRLRAAVAANSITDAAVKTRIDELIAEFDTTGNYSKTTEHLRNAAKFPGTDPVGEEIKTIMNGFQGFLAKAGLHGDTKDWSVKRFVESEHPIPHQVFSKATKNKVLQDYLKGAGGRAGEDCMPAITVERHKHRALPTTGKNDKAFCDELIKLGNEHNIPELLWRVLDSYDDPDPNKKLLTTTYKAGLLELFNTPGKYYQKMVEDDISANITDPLKQTALRTRMAACVTRVQSIV